MRSFLYRVLVLGALSVSGCAPAVNYTPMPSPNRPAEERAPRDPSAPVDVFSEARELPEGVVTVGEVRVSDTGFSMGCGYDAVLSRVLDKARSEGADAVYLVSVSSPDLLSTCYRMTARLIVYPEGYGTTAPSDRSSPRSAGDRALVGTGTGFFVDSLGHLLTNAHVVEECSSVTMHGHAGALDVVRVDSQNDLAVLRAADAPATVAVFREGRGIRSGDKVVAVGFPLSGLLANEANITTGGVSALAGLGDDFRFLQITAPVQPGNSGGPLLDTSGRIVGVVTSKLNALALVRATGDIPQNVNFAVNASVARIVLDAVGVQYSIAPANLNLSAADIGEMAKVFTVQLECRR